MDFALGIALGVVNDLMDELLIQFLVGVQIIGKNLRPRLTGRVDSAVQGATADTAKDASSDTAGLPVEAVTFQQADNRSLTGRASAGNHARLLVLVHEPGTTADRSRQPQPRP